MRCFFLNVRLYNHLLDPNAINYPNIMKTKFQAITASSIVRVGLIGASLVSYFLMTSVTYGSFSQLINQIENPSDDGSGPAIWFQSSAGTNSGSAASSLTAAGMNGTATDFFGTAGSAFRLPDAATVGVEINGGQSTSFARGANGTLVMTFRTPETLVNASLFNCGFAVPVHNPIFEVFQLGNGNLRLGVNDTLTNLAIVATETWYYLAVTWDTGLANNQVSWFLGEMGGTSLSSGTITAAAVGRDSLPIVVGGRTTGNPSAAFFQNVALYDRTLSSGAINDQFVAIPEPAVYAGLLGGLMLSLALLRRRRVRSR